MHRLMTFIAILIVAFIAGVNLYNSWSEGPPAEGICYTQSRFVIPDVCVGSCEGEICRPVSNRGYAFGLLEQPYECACVERGDRPKGSMGETGAGVTGVVVPPTF